MHRKLRLFALLLAAVLPLSACADESVDPTQVDAVAAPKNGLCRTLTTADIKEPDNATRTVDCSKPHNAETFAVGQLPDKFADVDRLDPQLGGYAYRVCSKKFSDFLGADESLVMRTVLTWAWFRPSEKAWKEGARWYRCDVVGGGEQSQELINLPRTVRGALTGRIDDAWMVCADGPTVSGSVKVPCSKPHTWRAVTTIKVGEPEDPYPGDRMVEVKTRDFCSKSVVAWLNYPDSYEFGYTWFREAEWKAGNRRSICWAKTKS